MTRLTFSNIWNRITGMGGDGDHSARGEVVGRQSLDPAQIAELLNHAPMVRTACEAMGEDIVRAWRKLPETGTKWLTAEEALNYRDAVERALFYAEAFGGAFVIPRFAISVAGATQMVAPFRQPRAGTLLGFRVAAPHQLRRSTKRTTNPTQGEHDLPTWFEMGAPEGGESLEIHHSWIYPFKGAMQVPSQFETGNRDNLHGKLGLSKVDLIYDDFARALAGLSGLSHLLVKASIDVFKIVGLAEAIRKCNTVEDVQKELMQLLQMTTFTLKGANIYQPMLIDSEEEMERKGLQATGADGIATKLLDVFVAATRIPRTRLLGEQSKGLGNGGEADLTNYYDRCGSIRERRVTPLLNWMDELAAADRGLTGINWDFAPLWQLSEKERADIEAKRAETDAKYMGMDIPFMPGRIVRRLAETSTYSFSAEQVAAIEETDGVIETPPVGEGA